MTPKPDDEQTIHLPCVLESWRGDLDEFFQRPLAEIALEEIVGTVSRLFELQAMVVDDDPENLFILWPEFKEDHERVLGMAVAKAARKRMDELGCEVGAVLCVPSSGSWLEKYLQELFPESQFPWMGKELPEDMTDMPLLHPLHSLTYTQRGPNGERLEQFIYVQDFKLEPGQVVLMIEDFLASGISAGMEIDDLGLLGFRDVCFVSAVSVDSQKGRERLLRHPFVRDVFSLTRVKAVKGKGQGRVMTYLFGEEEGFPEHA